MKEEQERPKIKLKVRQIEETEDAKDSFEGEQGSQNDIPTENLDENQPVQKIIIHGQRQEVEKEDENAEEKAKKRSIFQIAAIVLTILLVIAILVEVSIMLWLKSSTDDLKNKNNKIPQTESSISQKI